MKRLDCFNFKRTKRLFGEINPRGFQSGGFCAPFYKPPSGSQPNQGRFRQSGISHFTKTTQREPVYLCRYVVIAVYELGPHFGFNNWLVDWMTGDGFWWRGIFAPLTHFWFPESFKTRVADVSFNSISAKSAMCERGSSPFVGIPHGPSGTNMGHSGWWYRDGWTKFCKKKTFANRNE